MVDTLRRVPLFQELSTPELASLSAEASRKRYAPGQLIFSEGERGGDLLIVESGIIKVLKTAPSGRQQLLAIERAGSSLGEVSVFDGGAYSATAVASEPTVLLRISGEHFRAVCLGDPQVAIKVIRVLGGRLRQARRLIEELSFGTVRDRLIAHLLREAEGRGVQTTEGVRFYRNDNNEELAARLGTVRELVSRNLGRLHGEGFVIVEPRSVTIPDPERLRAELRQRA
jgi:CRP/FNR family transcriptional regulator